MLRLVYVNPNPVAEMAPFYDAPPPDRIPEPSPSIHFRETILAGFLRHFTAQAVQNTPFSYTLAARDLTHYLSCELALDIRESPDESEFGDVVCHFPVIDSSYLSAVLWNNDLLVEMVMLQFQLKVLEQLLTFCANHNALKLVIHMEPTEILHVSAYKEFVVHTEQILTHQGKKAALVIPTDQVTYGKLLDEMEETSKNYQEVLEEVAEHDPMVQQYMKFSAFNANKQDDGDFC